MKELVSGPLYLMRWDHSQDQRLGRDVVETTHRLTELPEFSDAGLAAILDQYPRSALRVVTMGHNPAHPSQLQLGELGTYSGLELIEMIRHGRLSVCASNVADHDHELGQVVQRLCGEMMECQPGLRTFDHDGDLEISSPLAMTYLGIDIQPNVTWQIRGTRTIWKYPADQTLVDPWTLEAMVASNTSTPLNFEPAFDERSKQYVQSPGSVLGLPQHTPYRIVNGDGLCVTLTTRYMTRESRRRNTAHRANYVLNRLIRSGRRSIKTSGFAFAINRLVLHVAGRDPGNAHSRTMEPTFRVNPSFARCVEPLTESTLNTEATTPIFPALSVDSNSAVALGSENKPCDPRHSSL